MPRTPIFVWDIGNVLLNWSPDNLYKKMIPDEQARAALFSRLPFDAMNLAGDKKGNLQAEVEALANAHPEDAALILPWWAGWERMCGGLIEESITLRDRLRAAGHRTWAMSNFAADSWERCIALYPTLNAFDGLVISGREGTVKPESRIMEIMEARTGATGADLFLIDDRKDNIAAARARGWEGHIFTDAAGLERALTEAGFI